ncbi:uncharacterized protein DSM5745_05779 [Aspergillus mulundensis]|uniref:Uncharacterized protein n=1 Tax=Aspergillus mulundensis TaxID=1810919 RepID=A0A3D8RXY4_9EURO|nr:hypothetical protein DSM5745_05779 [Aspergillus mulundensis]RDW78927.1 hypothetical protein DSM5745_05779 [Aspergillus mulundensis]
MQAHAACGWLKYEVQSINSRFYYVRGRISSQIKCAIIGLHALHLFFLTAELELFSLSETETDLGDQAVPFLGPAEPPPPQWTILGLTLVVSILYVFIDISRYLSSLRLLSHGICREHYLHTDPGAIKPGPSEIIPEELCTDPAIQQRVARLSSYLLALDAFLAFLFTIPYGLTLNRLSERFLAALNLCGSLLTNAWLLTVTYNWSVFPIWAAVLAPLSSVVGGGASIFDSVISVIVARRVPEAQRSVVLGLFSAAGLATQILSLAATTSLLDHGRLFTPLVLNFPIGLVALLVLSRIRPISNKEDADRQDEAKDPNHIIPALRHEIRAAVMALSRLLRRPRGLSLLIAVPLAKLADPLAEVTLLFVQRKFNTDFAHASRLLTYQTLEGLVLLAAVLPLTKHITQNIFHITPSCVDISIARAGFALSTLGCLSLGLAQTWAPYLFGKPATSPLSPCLIRPGLSILTLGWCIPPALKSLLTGMMPEKDIAALYTALALCDSAGLGLFSAYMIFASSVKPGGYQEHHIL